MKISQQQIDEVVLQVELTGELDTLTATAAQKELMAILEAGHSNLLIRMDQVAYISSGGLRVLLIVAKNLQQRGGKMALCALNGEVREVFDISGFSSIFKIFALPEEAKKFLKA